VTRGWLLQREGSPIPVGGGDAATAILKCQNFKKYLTVTTHSISVITVNRCYYKKKICMYKIINYTYIKDLKTGNDITVIPLLLLLVSAFWGSCDVIGHYTVSCRWSWSTESYGITTKYGDLHTLVLQPSQTFSCSSVFLRCCSITYF